MRKNMHHLPTILLLTIFMQLNITACKNEGCGYSEPCEEFCQLFEDFEDDVVGASGNWQTLAATVSVQVQGGTNTLYLLDGSGGSWTYNNSDFPKDLIEAGCELRYDVEYNAGDMNTPTAANSIHIYQGADPVSAASRAYFLLNSGSLIPSGGGVVNIVVPLELASGSTLPSNAFGEWVLVGGSAIPTAADIAAFNNLIQNISGVALVADNGGNPAEQWWYDNFCFQQCCK